MTGDFCRSGVASSTLTEVDAGIEGRVIGDLNGYRFGIRAYQGNRTRDSTIHITLGGDGHRDIASHGFFHRNAGGANAEISVTDDGDGSSQVSTVDTERAAGSAVADVDRCGIGNNHG